MTKQDFRDKHPRLFYKAIDYAFQKVMNYLGIKGNKIPLEYVPLLELVENAWLEGHGIHINEE